MKYLETDSLKEATRGLEFILHHLDRVFNDTYEWKWIIIGMDNTLQNYMVSALRDSMGYNVLHPKVRDKVLKSIKNNEPLPREYLNNFFNLYEDIQTDQMRKYIHSKKLNTSEKQEFSVEKLHTLRNVFIHFIPKGWLLYVTGLPKIMLDCISIIDFLVFKSNNIYFYEEKDEERTKKIISEINIKLKELDSKYNSD